MNINDTFLPYRDGVLFIDQNKIKYINLKNQEIEDFIKDISPQVFEGQKEKIDWIFSKINKTYEVHLADDFFVKYQIKVCVPL